jgi:hypothetical protein
MDPNLGYRQSQRRLDDEVHFGLHQGEQYRLVGRPGRAVVAVAPFSAVAVQWV